MLDDTETPPVLLCWTLEMVAFGYVPVLLNGLLVPAVPMAVPLL